MGGMDTPDLASIRTDYDKIVALAARQRARAIAAARAAGIPQKAIIEATGYSRESVRSFERAAARERPDPS